MNSGVERAIEQILRGRPIVLRDDVNRHGEGDLVFASEFATPDAVNFMTVHARGLVWLALTAERCWELGLEPIGREERGELGGAAMVSIEARDGVTTGISAADRARTIGVAADPRTGAEDLVQPGHVLPLRARPGGLLERRGRTEAAVYLAGAAGLYPAAAICEVMREDGHMAKGADLDRFAAAHELAVVSVSEVFEHQLASQGLPPLAEAEAKQLMRTVMGHFATGVGVITANDAAGVPIGTTANAITSVSLEPPLLLACLAEDSATLAAVRDTGLFAVNVLAADQRHHSDRFASKGNEARSHEVEFDRHELGVPLLPEALAHIACVVEAIHPAGDHEIVVGLARHLAHREPGARPLLFYRGAYSEIQIEEDELAA